MRIIGGSLKGKIILPPPEFKARPTTDVAKGIVQHLGQRVRVRGSERPGPFQRNRFHFIRIRITRSRTRLVGRNESAVFLIH